MTRYLIEEAKCGVTDGALMPCGTMPGHVMVAVKFKEFREGEEKPAQWLSLAEAEGYPNAYLSDKDIFDRLMEEDMEDTEFDEYLDEHYLEEFNGIAVYDYADLFESIQEDPDNPAAPLIRYAVALVRCAMEDVDDLIRMAKGRYADELDIPMSDVEEEYLEEHEEEE